MIFNKHKIPITINNNSVLNYEGEKKVLYFVFLPIMWLLSLWVLFKKKLFGKLKTNTFWFDGLSVPCRKIKEGAGSWKALDVIYNYDFGKDESINGKVSDFWIRIINAQAVRNRLRLSKYLLREQIEKFSRYKEVRVLSIASGSAQGLIEVMKKFKDKNIIVRATLLDLDPTAIEYSRRIAREMRVEDQVTFLNKSVSVLEKEIRSFDPHIIEMIGFLDYRPYHKAIKLIQRVRNLLLPGGVFLVSNTRYNPEAFFLKWVIDWSMIYRSPKKLAEIIIKAGFKSENCEMIYEPFKIHGIAICRKSA
ncbi:hypothetical protein LCGC14_2659070 [marine sediment metagenome]|uniref:Methyltransferase domain-containing protein n=1 Tax=marine sediment metagenome TaxID=412755 RepID=A0A0F8ZSH5_9ZZZZ